MKAHWGKRTRADYCVLPLELQGNLIPGRMEFVLPGSHWCQKRLQSHTRKLCHPPSGGWQPDVNMHLLPVTVVAWWQLFGVVQAMPEDLVGYSVLHDSFWGLVCFKKNPWVFNTQSYLETMQLKLEGQIFKSIIGQCICIFITFQGFCPIQCNFRVSFSKYYDYMVKEYILWKMLSLGGFQCWSLSIPFSGLPPGDL